MIYIMCLGIRRPRFSFEKCQLLIVEVLSVEILLLSSTWKCENKSRFKILMEDIVSTKSIATKPPPQTMAHNLGNVICLRDLQQHCGHPKLASASGVHQQQWVIPENIESQNHRLHLFGSGCPRTPEFCDSVHKWTWIMEFQRQKMWRTLSHRMFC